jgi:multicomponent Na+:H+ antiporter subunit E
MKYLFTLTLVMIASWLVWSGHFDKPFVLALGAISCILCMWLSMRMRIVDEEGAPAQLGFRPFTRYAPYLIREIVKSNLDVTKIILARKMPLSRTMIEVHPHQKSELGRVILANSITLTPGTVSVNMGDDAILVHALSFDGAEEDLSGDMDRRVCELENKK